MKQSLRFYIVIVFITFSFSQAFAQTGKPYAKLIPYYQNVKWGYCNKSKVIVIPCIFDSVTAFDCGESEKNKIVSYDYGYGYIKGVQYEVYENGKIVNYNKPELVYRIDKNKRLVRVKTSLKKLEDDFPPQVDEMMQTRTSWEIAGPDGKEYKFISSAGKVAKLYADGFYGLAELENGKYFERWILQPVYKKIEHIYYEDYYLAETENEATLFNLDTIILKKPVIRYTIIDAEHFPLDNSILLLFAGDGNEYSFYDEKGKKLPWGGFQDFAPSHYNKKHIGVKRNGKWGVITKTGKIIIPFRYDSVDVRSSFCNLIKVTKGNKRGYIDLDGKEYF